MSLTETSSLQGETETLRQRKETETSLKVYYLLAFSSFAATFM